MINRSAVVLRHAQPFIDWVAALEGQAVLPSLEDPPSVYLVPPFDSEEQALEVLDRAYPVLFERALDGWCTDDALWPADRDFAMFRTRFQIQLLPILEDICEGEIVEESPPEE